VPQLAQMIPADAPHSAQNFAPGVRADPQEPHDGYVTTQR
jgi:hypothetical protein